MEPMLILEVSTALYETVTVTASLGGDFNVLNRVSTYSGP
ncbi:hypothetical protein SAMN04515672_2511 [Natronorubrum texcoconense]|uniref:Uncharacterized protein n=1 Tax=Natronorubrum texcoconense TaxID=1095776 RepID=A0A1G8ZYQ7_9EURY|nr:hypothetical protein SAMN04515672_2511 [Natronorubrum texcoconense]